MLLEPGAGGVEIVVDPALVRVTAIDEQGTDHRCAHPELAGVQTQLAHAERKQGQQQEGDQYGHGSNASGKKIPPTVAVLTD